MRNRHKGELVTTRYEYAKACARRVRSALLRGVRAGRIQKPPVRSWWHAWDGERGWWRVGFGDGTVTITLTVPPDWDSSDLRAAVETMAEGMRCAVGPIALKVIVEEYVLTEEEARAAEERVAAMVCADHGE